MNRAVTRWGPDGFRIILPQGWVQLDVRADTDATVAATLATVPFDQIPRDDRPKRRAAIEGRLRAAIANAKKVDAYAMYVPLRGMHGIAVPASFVIGEATDFSGGGPQDEVIAQLLAAPGTQAAVVDGADGVRSETLVSETDDASGQRIPARQVVYTVPVPDSSQWLMAVFDVISDAKLEAEAAVLVDALVALFDAVMSTFRWHFPDR